MFSSGAKVTNFITNLFHVVSLYTQRTTLTVITILTIAALLTIKANCNNRQTVLR